MVLYGRPYLAIQSQPDIQLGFFPYGDPLVLSSNGVDGFVVTASVRLLSVMFESPTQALPLSLPSTLAVALPRTFRSGEAFRVSDSVTVASDVGNLAEYSIGNGHGLHTMR